MAVGERTGRESGRENGELSASPSLDDRSRQGLDFYCNFSWLARLRLKSSARFEITFSNFQIYFRTLSKADEMTRASVSFSDPSFPSPSQLFSLVAFNHHPPFSSPTCDPPSHLSSVKLSLAHRRG